MRFPLYSLRLPQLPDGQTVSRQAVAKLFLALYLPMALVLTGLVYGTLKINAEIGLQALQAQEAGEVKLAGQILRQDFEVVAADLRLLSKAPALKHFLDTGSPEEKQRLTALFLIMSQEKHHYDQIRYLDNSGMETIRVNLVNGKAEAVPGKELQNKAARYFFSDSLRLENGEIYISPLDLNIEHGQIEIPHKPMLRFGTPVFNSAGKKMGVGLINYYGSELIKDFRWAMAEKRHAMLLNRDGYWLSSPDSSLEWGFMFGRETTFAKQYPEAWTRIKAADEGSLMTEQGLLTHATVYPLLAGLRPATGTPSAEGASAHELSAREYYWKVVSLVPENELPSLSLTRHPGILALYLIGMALLALLASFMAVTMPTRRQFRRALAENEARLREITATLAEAVFVIDTRGYIVFVNPETERLLGWPEGELIGQHAHNKFHYREADGLPIPVCNCPISRALDAGRIYRGETEMFWRKDGTHVPVEVSVSPIVREGKMAGAVVAFSDISERKQIQERLLRNTAQLTEAQHLAHLGSWELDLASNALDWSEEIYRIFEIDPAVFGASYDAFLNAIHPEDRERVHRIYSESVANRVPYSTEHRLLFPDGQIKFVLERGETFYDAESRPLRSVGTVQDITERKQAEEAHLHAEALIHMVFDNVADAILIHDLHDGRFLEANQVACERLGYSREELLRLSPPDINSPEGTEKCAERGRRLLADGRITFETTHISKDGREIPVEVSSRLIDFNGKPATLSAVRDTTQRKAAQEALRQSEETARAMLNATSETALLQDRAGTVLAINEIGAKRLRMKPEDIVGRNVYDLLPPDVAARRKTIIDEAFRIGQPVHMQDERAGMIFDCNMYPVFDAQGKAERIAIYAADITERVQMQAVDTLLHAIDQHALRSESLSELLQFVCVETARLLDYRFAWVGRKEAGGLVSISAWSGPEAGYRTELEQVGVRWDDTSQGHGPAGTAIRTGQMQVFKLSDPGFHPWHDAARRFGLESATALPLVLRGEVYGAFMLLSRHARSFDDPATKQRLSGIATRICVALEMAMDQMQLRLIGTALASAGNGVFITDRRGRIQWINAAFTRLTGYAAKDALGFTPGILKSGRQSEAYYQTLWTTILQGETWSSETVERHKNGTLFTVQQTVTPIRDEKGEISHFISILEDITAQKEAEDRIQHMAHYDALTDLPNRSLLYDRLQQVLALAKRDEHLCALMFLDLDRFKKVNDSLGHHIGDLLLQGVAQRISACVRETDTVARLAGDEFIVILPHLAAREDAAVVAQKIVAALAEPFLLDGHEVKTSTSIGIALCPLDAAEDEELLKLADHAMYAAKQRGRNQYRFYADVRAPGQ
ncbi:PAS domain S-box protein [Sulfuricella sp.]|uniref:sensor domain-containing diguanylate cyclase n=1 Tax=Sulfuricella sp. TaxID=2099377 RepID=UPI002D7FA212|nr:PAS domain S-box protein [Sulfuricella sp.]